MRQVYYSLPFDTDALMAKRSHPVCSIRQSVADQLHLIITTAFGELQSDGAYGNSIWDNDFDNLTTRIRQQEMIKESLAAAVAKNEKRLDKIKVEVVVKQEEVDSKEEKTRFKKKVGCLYKRQACSYG